MTLPPLRPEDLVRKLEMLRDGDWPYGPHQYPGQYEDHIIADDLLCEVLESLGYTEAVEIYRAIPKWHG